MFTVGNQTLSKFETMRFEGLKPGAFKVGNQAVLSMFETRRFSCLEIRCFQATGQLDWIQCVVQPAPPRRCGRGVALQVEFERQILKPVFHLIGYRLWV